MYQWRPLERNEAKWIGVDFDDCLAKNTGFPYFTPQEPMEGAIEAIKSLVDRGYKIQIYTARPSSEYHNVEGWCKYYGIPIKGIICGKLLVRVLIDDKAMHFTSWEQALKDVEKFL